MRSHQVTMRSKVHALMFVYAMVYFRENKAQLIKGVMERCENEGGRANVSIVSGNPCFTCQCRNGVVQCNKEVCPDEYPCSMLIHNPDQCCRSCLTCTSNSITYESNAYWNLKDSKEDQCYDHVCQDGIVTRSRMTCHVPCSQPIAAPDGKCDCPTCLGCRYNDEIIPEGAQKNVDECTICKCKAGRMECRRPTCPVLTCESRRRVKDGCCYKCKGQRKIFKLQDGKCWLSRSILDNKESIKLDKCVSCVCQDGTVLCNKTICQANLQCHRADWIQDDDDCCPRCPTEIPTNCVNWKGETIQNGHIWKEEKDSCLNCKCSNGSILCQREKCSGAPRRCLTGQMLEKLPGKCCPSCVQEPGICAVYGDPHYRTFDGRPFNFQGNCRYILAKDCLGKNFSVVVHNVRKKSKHFSWTNSIQLTLYPSGNDSHHEVVVTLNQHLVLRVNNRKVSLPYVSNGVLAWVEHYILKLQTSAGVSLNWDGDSFLEVGVSSQYIGKLCGLCGNFNGFSRDDFIGGDGLFKFNDVDFATSWGIEKDNEKCSSKSTKERSSEPCTENPVKRVQSRKKCQIFKNRTFQTCFAAVDPKQYYNSCLTDTCECPRHRKCACESIRAYTNVCARNGINIKWNEGLHCKNTCERNKVYSTCGSPCKINCKNYKRLRRRDTCRRSCTAGCFCPAGSVAKGKRCVKISKCSKRTLQEFKHKFKDVNPFQHFLQSQDVTKEQLVLPEHRDQSGKHIEIVYSV